jgi:hypothetical protein
MPVGGNIEGSVTEFKDSLKASGGRKADDNLLDRRRVGEAKLKSLSKERT